MYAIVESGGFQFSAKEGAKLRIPKLKAKPKDKITFEKVLFIGGEKPLIGAPYIKDAKVDGEVLSLGKAEKITIFKFKKVKYRRKKGHRQEYTEIRIDKIHTPL